MRLSRYFICTCREVPREAESVSHQMMLKAGLIKKFSAGIYSYLPLGYRVLDKIIAIIKEEMDRIGAQQLLLPFVQPAELWKKSGRWADYGDELLRFQDRKGGEYVLSPTHEELITRLVGDGIDSYRKLPLILYQIQIKFRDELRPRGGIVRAREFLMKDAYSFCQDFSGLQDIYQQMKRTYEQIFTRCRLNYKLVEAESGPIGGRVSHEFIVPSDSGEDSIVECKNCGYTAKLEKTSYLPIYQRDEEKLQELKEISTPGVKTIEELSQFLGVSPSRMLKTLLYQTDRGLIAVVVRGDHQINETKLRELMDTQQLTLAGDELIKVKTGVEIGFAGPVKMESCPLIVDEAVVKGKNFITGSNRKDKHLINVNPARDFHPSLVDNIRLVQKGDKCPQCANILNLTRGMELGHLFQLGTKYSKPLQATFLGREGRKREFVMGCYGIGVSRLPAAIIEQNHDEEGIIWPVEVAPFQVIIISMGPETLEISRRIYLDLQKQGLEVLWDDRELRAGVKFKDADLMGIPLKVILGNTYLTERKVEIKERRRGQIKKVTSDKIYPVLMELLKNA